MSNGLVRAQFTFGNESEVRYITTPPAVGEHVRYGRELWRVSSAEMNGLGLSIVCQRLTSDESDVDRV